MELVIIVAAVAVFIWWWNRVSANWEVQKEIPPSLPRLSPSPPKVDTSQVDEARRRSLEAMNRASIARKADMAARDEKAAVPIWSGTQGIGSISFDYVDAKGKHSHRTVDVEAVDREYMEGHCHSAHDTRTFVIGRIRGDITDMETGELLRPKEWARRARDNPQNGEVTMGGERDRFTHGDNEANSNVDRGSCLEVLFTGFPKDKREYLEAMAIADGMRVVKSVTVGLDFLVAGPNAGPSKVAKAEDNGAAIISDTDFLAMVS